MVIDIQKLMEDIEEFEANEIQDWEKCPMSKLTASEKRGMARRKIIAEIKDLAAQFPACISND